MDVSIMTDYIKPELLILIPVLYFIGIGLKQAQWLKDKRIPLLLGLMGVFLSLTWVLSTTAFTTWQDIIMATFTAIVQGVLVAGYSVYVNQIAKQMNK